MMSAQMLASADTVAGTVSDLAPGAKDGMRMLEARAVAMNQPEDQNPPISHTPSAPPPAGSCCPLPLFLCLALPRSSRVVMTTTEVS